MVEGRARDQRDDGRRRPYAAPIPRIRGDATPPSAAGSAAQQRSDGTWANFYEGPPDSHDVEAYVALRLAGDDPDRIRTWPKAADFIVGRRGSAVPGLHAALDGALRPVVLGRLPALPPEVIFLPCWFPLNSTTSAVGRARPRGVEVVVSSRPCRPLSFDIDELRTAPQRRRRAPPPCRASGDGLRSDGAPRGASPPRPTAASLRGLAGSLVGRRLRRRACGCRTVDGPRQEADGCWGGIQPPWVYSILAFAYAATNSITP